MTVTAKNLYPQSWIPIDVADPAQVCAEVSRIFGELYPKQSLVHIERCFTDLTRLYSGDRAGFHSCDMAYHDLEHVLGVTLAMARLIDGHERTQRRKKRFGYQLALVGLITALFHDSGYLRRASETMHREGAEFTRVHVTRSAEFLAEYLPEVGLGEWSSLARKIVQFTGYEVKPSDILMENPMHRVLGKLVGTADLLAQMADPQYLQRCRDNLYLEFKIGGVAEYVDDQGIQQCLYESGEDLLRQTPKFIRNTLANRLGILFGHTYRYMDAHFDGRNPYMDGIKRNCEVLESLIARKDPQALKGPLRIS